MRSLARYSRQFDALSTVREKSVERARARPRDAPPAPLIASLRSARALAPLCASLMAASAALAGTQRGRCCFSVVSARARCPGASQVDEPSGVAGERATSALAAASSILWSAARAWALARQRAVAASSVVAMSEAAALLAKATALVDDAAAALANAGALAQAPIGARNASPSGSSHRCVVAQRPATDSCRANASTGCAP